MDEASIPLCEPYVGEREWELVRECLETGMLAGGPFVARFEQLVSAAAGGRETVATASGTAALHVALLVAGVRPGDEVVVSTLTFVATANAIRQAGAVPVFVDAEPEHWQIDVERVREFLVERCERTVDGPCNRRSGRRVGALVPVHVLGHPVDADPLYELACEHGLPVVEDATEALGASYRGRPLGSLGRLACFSFNGNKIVTAAAGGAVVASDPDDAARLRYLINQAKDDPVEYVHGAVGFNYRLSNVHAAIGTAQMERLAEHVAAKRAIAARYDEALGALSGVEPMRAAPWAEPTWWLYTVQVDPARYGRDSRALLRELESGGIQTRPLWQPLHLSPAYSGCEAVGGEVAERLWAGGLSLPCSVRLAPDALERVVRGLRSARSR